MDKTVYRETMKTSLVGYATYLHTRNHLIKEIGRVRHPSSLKLRRTSRRINIEEATGTISSPRLKTTRS